MPWGVHEFRKLSSVWRDDPEFAEKVNKWERAILWWTRVYERYFSFVDWEPTIREALYIAIYTYEPGRGSFLRWLRHWIRATASTQRRKELRKRGRLTRIGYFASEVDMRYYYRTLPGVSSDVSTARRRKITKRSPR